MTFEGFSPPVDDFFRMPNAWINICAHIDSLAELKVVQYVLRHTWGYQGFSGARKITIDEFMHGRKRKDGSRIDEGTGLSKQSVITAVESAAKHGYLVCNKDTNDLARQKKYYQLAMKADVKHLDTVSDVQSLDIGLDVKNLDIPGVKELDHDVKNLDSDGQEFRHRSEKDTLERHLEKDTLERQEHALSFSENENHSHFFEQETICLQCGNLTDNPDACTSCQLAETKHRIPAITLNGATDELSHIHTGLRIDLSNGVSLPDGHRGDRDRSEVPAVSAERRVTPVAIASIPGAAADPPTAAIVRQSQTTPKSRVAQGTPTVPEGHERFDGAATDVDGEPRASGNGHSARAEQASQATLQQQAAGATAQNGAGTRQAATDGKVTQAIQKPLSLKEDEPTVRPETPTQRKRRIEAREKEIWVLVEEKLGTKFYKTHRQTKANLAGMEHLIEDDTDDDTIKTALDRLSDFWKAQFDLEKFHRLIPGLLATNTQKPSTVTVPVKQNYNGTGHAKRMRAEAERQALLSQSKLQA